MQDFQTKRQRAPRAARGGLAPAGSGRSPANRGFSLVEALIAMLLVSVILLGVVPLVGVSVEVGHVAGELTETAVSADEKIEELAQLDYLALNVGGSLDADVGGFFDLPDVDNDGTPDLARRWQVIDLGTGKEVRVRVFPLAAPITGDTKTTDLVVLVPRL